MAVFEFAFVTSVPFKAVTDFHKDPRALRKLSPPPVILKLSYVEPLAEGSKAEFIMWFGPIPLRWVAVHQNVSQNGFTDIQEEGPLKFWKHTHHFELLDSGNTQVRDRIEYEYQKGLSGLLSRVLFNSFTLSIMFLYRKWVICHLKD